MSDSTDATPSPDFPTHFDFAAAEPALSAAWQSAGVFTADPSRTTRLGGDRDIRGRDKPRARDVFGIAVF